MQKSLCLSLALFFFNLNFTNSQTHYNSFSTDNYSGTIGGFTQPASLVDNRFQWNVSFGGNYSVSNNYIANNFNHFFYGVDNQKSAYKKPLGKGYYYKSFEAVPVSFLLQLTDKDAVGYSWRYRSFTNFDGLEDELTDLDFNSFTGVPSTGINFNQGRLSYQFMEWSEHTFNYARTVIDDKERVIKAGIGLKLLNGVNAHQLQTNGGNVTFNPNNQLDFDGMEFSFGKSDQSNQLNNDNLGFGADIGVIYEHRPDYKSFFYEMDRVRKNPSKHLNKYKYKISASITDIGGIKFTKDTNTYDFVNSNNNQINYAGLFSAGLGSTYLENTVLPSMVKSSDNKSTFRMSLPTALNAQFDYNILPKIYVNYSGSLPIWFKSDKSKVHDLMTHTFSGRYETRNVSAGLPITIQRNGQVNVGLYASARMESKRTNNAVTIFAGANNINNLLGQRRVYNANFYAGVAIGRMYKKPSDIDGDLISDEKDMCPTDSGGYKLKGCPDFDEDGIPDYKDFCPYSAGPKKYNGCPDTDGDGILDYEDHCPYNKGLRANKGCPDRDKDGIIDTADRCPDIPGVWENNGCPMEDPESCCMDSDGDGINDRIDSCIYEPGPATNNGCPEKPIKRKDKTEYEKIEKQKLDEVFEETKTTIETKTVKQVLDEMTTIDYINIYFEVDKDKIQPLYDKKIEEFVGKINQNANTLILILGHTDSDGSLDYNMKLSAKRSEAAKKRLMKLGVEENRLVIKNYGEEKPAEENSTVENKSKNRRVEIRMMKIHY